MTEAEEVVAFDLSQKKKKKKKPTAAAAAGAAEAEPSKAADVGEAASSSAPAADEGNEGFDTSLKKKKKKKVRAEKEDDEAAAAAVDETVEKAADDFANLEVSQLDNMFSGKKKKKKVTVVDADNADQDYEDGGKPAAASSSVLASSSANVEAEADEDMLEVSKPKKEDLPWAGTDRDYTYDELLNRVFGQLLDSNPELAGGRKRYQMKPPQVVREGTRKTVWANFTDICQTMRRQPEHLLSFVMAELGTSGSLDGAQRLVIKGRFQPKQIESILRRYISEYVTCQMCKSPATQLFRNPATRLYFMKCETCGSVRSVQTIKAGFQAQIGKRKKV